MNRKQKISFDEFLLAEFKKKNNVFEPLIQVEKIQETKVRPKLEKKKTIDEILSKAKQEKSVKSLEEMNETISQAVKGEIVNEEKWNIDLEDAFIEKWQHRFKKINQEFDNIFPTKKIRRNSHSAKKTMSIEATQTIKVIFTLSLAVAFALNVSFYSLYFFPNKTINIISRMDATFQTPAKIIRNLSSNYLSSIKSPISEPADNAKIKILVTKKTFSSFIKNKIKNINFDEKNNAKINLDDLIGQVAGVEERVDMNNFSKIEQDTSATEEIRNFFQNISDWQKKTSNNIRNKIKKLATD